MSKRNPRKQSAFDCHHILYIRRNYSGGYARALREHPWLRVYIPRDTLHHYIHHHVKSIPVPDGKDARRVFEYLMRLERSDELDYESDILDRLDFLISHLSTPETVEALARQAEVIKEFYSQPSSD